MISGLRSYPAVKDSGVPWLGEVPEHWEVRRLKNVCSLRSGEGITAESIEPQGDFPVFGGNGIRGFARHFTHDGEFPLIGRQGALCGNVHLASGQFWASEHAVVASARRGIDPRWLAHTLRAMDLRQHSIAAAQPGLAVERIVTLPVGVPAMNEQTAIVRLLDYADRRIRRYIHAKQKLIKLLEEQKRAVINRAVTRGLDPDVRHKPSGVEWLGDVPEHWEVVRAKRVFRPRTELARKGDVQLSATQAYGVIAQADFEERIGRKVTRIEKNLDKRRHVEADDFVISMRSFQGGLERAWQSGCIRSSYVVLQAVRPVCVPFFQRVFKSRGYIGALQATANFIRDGQDLNYDNFCAVDLPWPPPEEQARIATGLQALLDGIEKTKQQALQETALLREYRTRLIADVVTGKLDVREAASRLPEEVDEIEPLEEADGTDQGEDQAVDEAELEEVEV